jgi:hypothetical protein
MAASSPASARAPLRLGRRVAQIDEDLAVALRDRVAAHRIAADERFAAGELELPVANFGYRFELSGLAPVTGFSSECRSPAAQTGRIDRACA